MQKRALQQFILIFSVVAALFVSPVSALACACLTHSHSAESHSCCPETSADNHCPPEKNSGDHHAESEHLSESDAVQLLDSNCNCIRSAPPSKGIETQKFGSQNQQTALLSAQLALLPILKIERRQFFARNLIPPLEFHRFSQSTRAPPRL